MGDLLCEAVTDKVSAAPELVVSLAPQAAENGFLLSLATFHNGLSFGHSLGLICCCATLPVVLCTAGLLCLSD